MQTNKHFIRNVNTTLITMFEYGKVVQCWNEWPTEEDFQHSYWAAEWAFSETELKRLNKQWRFCYTLKSKKQTNKQTTKAKQNKHQLLSEKYWYSVSLLEKQKSNRLFTPAISGFPYSFGHSWPKWNPRQFRGQLCHQGFIRVPGKQDLATCTNICGSSVVGNRRKQGKTEVTRRKQGKMGKFAYAHFHFEIHKSTGEWRCSL